MRFAARPGRGGPIWRRYCHGRVPSGGPPAAPHVVRAARLTAMRDGDELRVPLVAEEAVVGKRMGAAERVRVTTATETREELVTGDLRVEALAIERRRVERLVDTAPPPREEGDTTVISVVEERAVVTRQLVVVEEIVIRRRVEQQSFAVPFALRRTRVDVERATLAPDPSHQENR